MYITHNDDLYEYEYEHITYLLYYYIIYEIIK